MAAKNIKINICDWLDTLISVTSQTVVPIKNGQKFSVTTDGIKTWSQIDQKPKKLFIVKNKKTQSS